MASIALVTICQDFFSPLSPPPPATRILLLANSKETRAMDWTAAIEKNREALKRILAMLVAMAGLADADPGFPSPLRGGESHISILKLALEVWLDS